MHGGVPHRSTQRDRLLLSSVSNATCRNLRQCPECLWCKPESAVALCKNKICAHEEKKKKKKDNELPGDVTHRQQYGATSAVTQTTCHPDISLRVKGSQIYSTPIR